MRIFRGILLVMMTIYMISVGGGASATNINDHEDQAGITLVDRFSVFPLRHMDQLLITDRQHFRSVIVRPNMLASKTPTWEIPTMEENKTARIHVPILCYHVVSTEQKSTMYTPYWQLDDHLKTLKEQGYTTITPRQLYEAYYLNEPLPEKPIMITFDDGYYDNYSLGYPLFKKYDMQATIFIIGSAIQERDNTSVTGGLPRLSWENIQAMDSHVTVQNHTYASHYKSPTPKGREVGVIATPLKVDDQWEGVHRYWERLATDFLATESLLKEKVGYGSYIFSYPYGQSSDTTQKVLKHLKIPLAVTIKKGVATTESSLYELPRLIVNGTWSGEQLMYQIAQMK